MRRVYTYIKGVALADFAEYFRQCKFLETKRIAVGGIMLAGILFFSMPLVAQNRDVILTEAARAWSEGDYPEAAMDYREAFLLDSTDLFCAYRLAECYRYDNAYRDAARMYRYVAENPESAGSYPEAWYYLALMTRQQGNYLESCTWLEGYLRLNGDAHIRKRAEHEYRLCVQGGLPSDSLPVRITHLAKNVNTPFSEFAALQLNDSLFCFSAVRPTSGSDFQSFASFDYRSAIYLSDIKVSGFSKPVEMSSRINKRNTHNANASFDPGTGRLFFSRCSDVMSGSSGCHIMVSSLKNGHWSKPVKLPGAINLDEYASTQPHFARVADAGVLYFVSNRPGGFGEMDIWYAISKDDGFGEPVNCGSIINTPGNEVTPFYDSATSSLFFSSDWHPGYGGYDIFRASGGMAGWEKVQNTGVPLNSPANDFYFSINPTDSNGYFTSNRPGSFHLRGETCCNDVYSYEWIITEPPVDTPAVVLPEENDSLQELARSLLPLMLFFHNDEPDPATRSVTSTMDYRQTLDAYVALKGQYKAEYARGLKGREATKASQEIEAFFDQYVLNGYEKLERLSQYLLRDLEAGNTVQLLISGYCSPLSTNEYNINLARRRIHSLVKFIEKVHNGAFVPYLNATAPGGQKLLIYEDPVGKEKASPFVSDNPNDLRNSVYSRAAAFERRIEISMYMSGKPGEMALISEMPRFSTPSDTLLLEAMKPGEKRVVSIPFRNEGKSELMIRNVEFNGEKVWVEWSNEPLLPGGERALMVLLTPGTESGPFVEKIVVYTNLPEPVTITLSGYVKE